MADVIRNANVSASHLTWETSRAPSLRSHRRLRSSSERKKSVDRMGAPRSTSRISCGVSVRDRATAFSLTWAGEPDSGIATTLPLRMVHASATALAEQLCAAPIRVSRDREPDCRRRAESRLSRACRVVRTTAAVHIQCHGYRDCNEPDWSRSDGRLEYETDPPCR